MSKKRASPESSNEEQTNEDSDLVFQRHANAKRAKLISLSNTTLQDLPMELIECILVKAVAMEVMGMNRSKGACKAKADLVINRLKTVCSQWSNILTTNFFRNELQRTFDAQKTIRLEILHQSPLRFHVSRVVTMKDEIFMLCGLQHGDFDIRVHDRNNLTEVKDVIPLPEIWPERIAACSVSNCLYILYKKIFSYIRISRITKVAEHQFNITPLISDVWMPNPRPTLSVAANGSLIFSRQQRDLLFPVISIYNPDGTVQHQMRMSPGIPKFSHIIPKSNGNLLLVSTNDQMLTALTEIDMDVTIIRQLYQSSCNLPYYIYCKAIHADPQERMLLGDRFNRMELLDSEFNLQEFSGPQLDATKFIYSRERNEVITIVNDGVFPYGALTIFRFTENKLLKRMLKK